MSTPKKPSSLSVLKNLPPERQEEIFDRLSFKRPPHWPDNSQTAVRKWLAADGVKTSEAALSEFFSWYGLQQQLARNESTVETLLARYKEINQDATPEKMHDLGQEFFSALAMQQQDPKGWFLTQTLLLKRQSLAFDQEKFAESKKSDQEKALERCLDDSKEYPEVQEKFKEAFAALKKARAKK